MLEFADHVDLADVDGPLVDTCGTGGDGAGTVNVSTMAAVVTAAAGAQVAKHGGRAASSKCGSVDVLETLGVVIDLGPDGVARCVREVGIGFCFAQRFHPAMRFAAPVRRQLGTPTTFNFLGPLANPAGADPPHRRRVRSGRWPSGSSARSPRSASSGRSCSSATTASTSSPSPPRRPSTSSSDGDVRIYDVDPLDVGIPHAELGALAGGDAAGNAQAVHQVFAGAHGPDPRHRHAQRRRRAWWSATSCPTSPPGSSSPGPCIDDGRAAATLEAFVRVSVAAREAGIG